MKLFLTLLFAVFVQYSCEEVLQLNSSNWRDTSEGHWFIEFFAPWCPACRQFSSVWSQFSNLPGLNLKVGAIDVTENPVLSFTFFVRQLPTLYHVKDGQVRLFDGPRDLKTLQSFIFEKKFEKIEPVAWYYSPFSLHMICFSHFMEVGMTVTRLHQSIQDQGYPTWMSFIFIGIGTIIVGLTLGTILVILFDCFVPPRPQIFNFFKKRASTKDKCGGNEDESSTPEATDSTNVDGKGEHENVSSSELSDETDVRKRAT